ncbi:MAG: flagellar brake protein [Burkholderiaceae bacterium]
MKPDEVVAQFLPETDLEKLAEFKIEATRPIRRLLDDLANKKALISLYSNEDPSVFIVSRIKSVEQDAIELEIQTERERRVTVLQHGYCTVVGFMDQLKVQFEATFIDADPESQTVRCEMPAVLFRIQRRSAYRVRPPIGQPGQVAVRLSPGKEHHFELLDLSATGLSFKRVAEDETFEVGDVIEHARMELGPRIPVPCSFEVRTIIRLQTVIGMPAAWRIGCEFVNMPAEVERSVQVYVQDVERTLHRLRSER